MEYVEARTATRASVEDALNAAFTKVFGVEMVDDPVEPVVSESKAQLSPKMWRIVNVLQSDGGWVRGDDLKRKADAENISETIRFQRHKLEIIGKKIISHTHRGYKIVDASK